MPCSIVKLPGGGIAFMKHSAPRVPHCKFCYGSQPATLLCDFEIGETIGGDPITCDAKVCVHCAHRVGEKDFCPKHPRVTE